MASILKGESSASDTAIGTPAPGWVLPPARNSPGTAVRWWCATTLGKHWNPRLIIVPGAELVRSGPYRWVHHPNYMAVAAEVVALPLVHSAWLTAIVFTIANAAVLRVRISAENRALGYSVGA